MGRRHKRYRLSNTFFLIIALVIFGMGIGYAAISTTLTIDGTSDIDSASWDVHFNNIRVTSGSVSATTPAISNNTSVSFSANLANPGDFYEFKIDVVNAGTLDAKLDGITILPNLTLQQTKYFYYTVTYEDGTSVDENDSLAAGVTETLLIHCEYLTQTDASLYPTDDMNFDFSVSMTYVQGHGYTRTIVYTTSSTELHLGEAIPNGVVTYDNFIAAEQAFGKPMFIRHVIKNNLIVASYVGGDTDPLVFYMKGADSSSYGSNIKAMQMLYIGDCDCNFETLGNGETYHCTRNGTTFAGHASSYGDVYIEANGYQCRVFDDGSSRCFQF